MESISQNYKKLADSHHNKLTETFSDKNVDHLQHLILLRSTNLYFTEPV